MGQRKGYKQTKEHIEKRIRRGREHHMWKGSDITVESGRNRAERMFDIRPCDVCGESKKRIDRHHIDGNTVNNSPENIQFLCRKCHMEADGRLEKFNEIAMSNLPLMREKAKESRAKITHCPKGHPYSGDNLYVNPSGSRVCRKCINDYKRAKRREVA